MRSIEISDALFARLQKLALPLVDTPATLLERLITVYEVHIGLRGQDAPLRGPEYENQSPQAQRELEPGKVPSLRHTRILAAEFAGRKAERWNCLVHVAHIEAVQRLGSVEAVRRISRANIMTGCANTERTRAGYRYVAEINACIQNVDANHAWSSTFRLAKALKVAVEAEIEWLPKSEAAYPGKTARLFWKPKDEAFSDMKDPTASSYTKRLANS